MFNCLCPRTAKKKKNKIKAYNTLIKRKKEKSGLEGERWREPKKKSFLYAQQQERMFILC